MDRAVNELLLPREFAWTVLDRHRVGRCAQCVGSVCPNLARAARAVRR